MAEGKKSFLLYCDILHTVEHLTDDQAGKLFKHIIAYVNDKSPETEDIVIKLAFEPIKQQLKRDLKEWEETRRERSESGKRGMAVRWGNTAKQKITKDNTAINDITKITVNDTVTVNVNDNVNEIQREKHTNPNVFYNAETEILKNPIWLEKIFTGRGIQKDTGLEILRTYHLYLTEKEQYPKGKRALFAGFERWINNEKKFNGHKTTTKGTGAQQLIAKARQDFANARREADT